jgi:hypothetical protein
MRSPSCVLIKHEMVWYLRPSATSAVKMPIWAQPFDTLRALSLSKRQDCAPTPPTLFVSFVCFVVTNPIFATPRGKSFGSLNFPFQRFSFGFRDGRTDRRGPGKFSRSTRSLARPLARLLAMSSGRSMKLTETPSMTYLARRAFNRPMKSRKSRGSGIIPIV